MGFRPGISTPSGRVRGCTDWRLLEKTGGHGTGQTGTKNGTGYREDGDRPGVVRTRRDTKLGDERRRRSKREQPPTQGS